MQRPVFRKSSFRLKFLNLISFFALLGAAAYGSTSRVFTLAANSSSAEIQKALDSLPPNGEVVLSPGTYEITQPIFLRHDNETLRGSGAATILHLADKANCPVIVLGPPLTETKRMASHLRLADLVIDGNRKNQKVEFWHSAGDGSEINNNGIQIWNVTNVLIEKVVCCHCRSGGMVTASVRDLMVNDFDSFDNEFDGLACYETEDSHFSGLHLHDNLGAGISLDLAFNHNVITNAQLAGNDLGIFMRDSRDNTFEQVTISKSHNHGVFIAQTAEITPKGWQLSPGTECCGNNFEKLNINDCGGKPFLVNNDSCTNNAVLGALFIGNIVSGLALPTQHLVRIRDLIEH